MISRILASVLISPIRAYKFFLSPWVGHSCRFTPTCSSYAIEAIETHGPVRGLILSTKRVTRCHPWCGGGHDPVPETTAQKNQAPKNEAPNAKTTL
jgi:putative membrane protein insertion efficiency factor